MGSDTALEERRKKATLRKIERKHAGKVVQPYAILERLIADVEAFRPLKKARFCLLWKSGWKTDKDGVLTRAQIAKASEDEREKYGEYDFTIKLHKELWALKSFRDDDREMDLFHELLHAQPEIDDSTGEQKVDERDRLCWRVRRRHPIQEFPEVIERYGLERATGMNAAALAALDDEEARREAEADANDAERPLLRQSENGGTPTLHEVGKPIEALGISAPRCEKLHAAGIGTVGDLRAAMQKDPRGWFQPIKGIGREAATDIEDRVNAA